MMETGNLPELKSKESPFDHWSRERLVRFAQRCYAAMEAGATVARLKRYDDEDSPFWTRGGTGGTAIALVEAVEREVGYDWPHDSLESENLWRAFYRTLLPLLFEDAVGRDGEAYFPPTRYTCDVCGVWNDSLDGRPLTTFYHGRSHCPGTPRLMTAESDLPDDATSHHDDARLGEAE